jgi:hypothetical protein
MTSMNRIVLSLALIHVSAACLGGEEALERHRALWASAAVADYEYGYRKYCECNSETPPETVITVRAGEVVGVVHRPAGTTLELAAEERNLQYYWTVEDLFSLVDSALARAAEVRVTYDETLGHPTEIYINNDTGFISDDVDVRLTRLEPGAP